MAQKEENSTSSSLHSWICDYAGHSLLYLFIVCCRRHHSSTYLTHVLDERYPFLYLLCFAFSFLSFLGNGIGDVYIQHITYQQARHKRIPRVHSPCSSKISLARQHCAPLRLVVKLSTGCRTADHSIEKQQILYCTL
jgi:hypothetical protein